MINKPLIRINLLSIINVLRLFILKIMNSLKSIKLIMATNQCMIVILLDISNMKKVINLLMIINLLQNKKLIEINKLFTSRKTLTCQVLQVVNTNGLKLKLIVQNEKNAIIENSKDNVNYLGITISTEDALLRILICIRMHCQFC